MAWDPALITAIAGAVAIGGGLIVNARGQRDTKKQQAAANEMVKDKTRLEETQQALDTYETLTERLAVETARSATRADNAEARSERTEMALEKERRDRALDRAAFQLIEDRCRTQTAQLVEAVALLRATVVSEIAQAAMDKAMAEITEHPHGLPGVPGPEAPRQIEGEKT